MARGRPQKVMKKRIFRVRNYGFSMMIRDYSKDIYREAYSRKNLDKAIKQLVKKNKIPSEAELDMFYGSDLDEKKLREKIKEHLKKGLDHGNKKVMTLSGEKLDLPKPNYELVLNELQKDNLKYVKDITKDQKKEILKSIKKGFDKGKGITKIKKDIVKNVKDMTKNRAETIARTEMNRSSAKGMETTMEKNNIEHYHYVTAGDNRVADICNINSFGNAEGTGRMIKWETGASNSPIPVVDSHINCRCVMVKAKEE